MQTIATVLERLADAYRRREPATLAALYAPEAVVSSPMFPHARGRAAIEQSFASLFRIFPDWDLAFEDATCTNAHRAMQACKVKATQQSDFMGVPGSGRRVQFDCVLILDIDNGLITHERRIYDFTGVLIQLGVLRGKPAS